MVHEQRHQMVTVTTVKSMPVPAKSLGGEYLTGFRCWY